MTTKEKIVNILSEFPSEYLAVHEIPGRYFSKYGCYILSSENAIASRIDELQQEGKVRGRYRAKKRFKEWVIVINPVQLELIQNL